MSGIAGFPMPPHIKDRFCQLLKEEEDNKKNDKKEYAAHYIVDRDYNTTLIQFSSYIIKKHNTNFIF